MIYDWERKEPIHVLLLLTLYTLELVWQRDSYFFSFMKFGLLLETKLNQSALLFFFF